MAPNDDRLNRRLNNERAKPQNELEALMMAGPGEELSVVMKTAVSRAVAAVLEGLSEDEKDMLMMRLVSEMSVRDIADCMGMSKSDVHRRLPPLIKRVKDLLRADPTIKEYLNG
jgi:RNA polymerase sigma factor (sigma-70 family)